MSVGVRARHTAVLRLLQDLIRTAIEVGVICFVVLAGLLIGSPFPDAILGHGAAFLSAINVAILVRALDSVLVGFNGDVKDLAFLVRVSEGIVHADAIVVRVDQLLKLPHFNHLSSGTARTGSTRAGSTRTESTRARASLIPACRRKTEPLILAIHRLLARHILAGALLLAMNVRARIAAVRCLRGDLVGSATLDVVLQLIVRAIAPIVP